MCMGRQGKLCSLQLLLYSWGSLRKKHLGEVELFYHHKLEFCSLSDLHQLSHKLRNKHMFLPVLGFGLLRIDLGDIG